MRRTGCSGRRGRSTPRRIALRAWAQTKVGDEADRLFRQAGEKYAEAVRLKPDDHQAFNNWGNALDARACTQVGDEADRLFREAGEKYAEAVRLKPDDHEAFDNWGGMLLCKAQRHPRVERDALLREAQDKLKHAEALRAGSGAYNLACVASLRGEEGECRRWLEVARDCGRLPDRAHLEGGADLDPVRDSGWFRELIASL